MARLFIATIVVAVCLGAVQPTFAQLPPEFREQVQASAVGAVELAQAAARGEGKRQEAEPPQGAAAPERGYLGATADDREDRGRGVRIVRIIPGSPAQQAGLQPGDLVTGLGGVRVRQISDMAAILQDVAPGNLLTFEILRGKEAKRIDVTFGRRGAPDKRATVPEHPPAARPAEEVAPVAPPPPVKAGPPLDDHARLEILERRIQQLENRIRELERAAKGK